MTIQKAYILLEELTSTSSNKSEILVYEKFLQILIKLKKRTFSKEEIQLLETELDRLLLKSNIENNKKYYKKALSEFEKFLKDTFSLTPEGYYTKLIGGLGLSFGLLFGVAILSNLERSLGISLGLIGGMVIGSIIGRTKDAEVKKARNML